MHRDLGICKGPGLVLGQIYVGPDTLAISKIGRYFYALLNNRVIMASKSKKELLFKTAPVLSHVIKHLSKVSQLDAARWRLKDKRYTDMILDTIKSISKNLEPVEIYLLEAKPDETQDNRSILSDKRGIVEKLNIYSLDLKKYEETKDNIQKTSSMLLRTSLDKSLWGSKEVMDVINAIKSEMDVLSMDSEIVDGSLERSNEQLSKLRTILIKKIASDQIKDVIGKIIEHFSILKSFLSRLIQVLHPFYGIDHIFKSFTGYPSTWFFDGVTFMDFIFEYDNMVKLLVKFAQLESGIIEPLLIWRIKLTGEKHVR